MKSSGVAKWCASMAFWRQLHAGVATTHPPPMRLCLPCHQAPYDVTLPPLASECGLLPPMPGRTGTSVSPLLSARDGHHHCPCPCPAHVLPALAALAALAHPRTYYMHIHMLHLLLRPRPITSSP